MDQSETVCELLCERSVIQVAVLYIREQGAYVQKSGDRLVVSKQNMRLLEIPAFQVENDPEAGWRYSENRME